MTEEQRTFLKDLSEEYNLTKDDFFLQKTQGWVIIKRTGIDKIQAKAGIQVMFTLERSDENVIVKAIGEKGDKYIESYGEASLSNYRIKKDKQGNEIPRYPIAMAEKRALSRVVLKLVGAYAKGVYSEDEAEEFKK